MSYFHLFSSFWVGVLEDLSENKTQICFVVYENLILKCDKEGDIYFNLISFICVLDRNEGKLDISFTQENYSLAYLLKKRINPSTIS